MSSVSERNNRRRAAKRKADTVQASRAYNLKASDIEEWISKAMSGMENQLKTRPKSIARQCKTRMVTIDALSITVRLSY